MTKQTALDLADDLMVAQCEVSITQDRGGEWSVFACRQLGATAPQLNAMASNYQCTVTITSARFE